MEFGNQYHDTSMMHINQTGGKHLKKSILIINENIDEAEKIKKGCNNHLAIHTKDRYSYRRCIFPLLCPPVVYLSLR